MVIGIDIGGTKTLAAISSSGDTIETSAKIPTPKNQNEIPKAIFELISQLSGNEKPEAITIASPGPLDSKAGIIIDPPNLPWKNFEIIAELKKHFTDIPISLIHDTDAATWSEAKIGAGRGQQSVLYLTISTGVGMGLVTNGQLYHGKRDTEAGHIVIDQDGPICSCGERGHLEALISGVAIKKKYGKYAYEIDDPKIWNEIARNIALGLHNLITTLSPGMVILGGGVSVHWDKFHHFMMEHLKSLETLNPLPEIVLAKNIETATVLGALLLAKDLATN